MTMTTATPTAYYSELSFFDAWARGVAIAGPRFFGDGHKPFSDAKTKHDLAPDYDHVLSELGQISSGEAVFLAAMYSFYNATAGAKMLAKLGISSPGDIAASLDEKRRRVLADLMVSYAGW